MCGIAGAWSLDGSPASQVITRKMTDAIAHRGPDGEGFWHEGPVGFGHRRLAIIDLSPGGHQPKQDSSGRYVITYNGELYNYREMRIDLERLGCRFVTDSDTEVVLNAFAQWGTDAIPKFNGMFAIAVWDRKQEVLTLARDRFGVKPLYWSDTGGYLLFGSEIKALLAHPCMRAGIDPRALAEYLTFQNFLDDRTLFSGIKILPAGCILTAKSMSGRLEVQIHRYWDFTFQEPSNRLSEAQYEEEFDFLFRQAVSRQLVSDVDVAAYLSGGIDSGSIVAIASEQLPHLRTFTCGFDLNSASGMEMAYDERSAAERMSYLFRTEHYEMVLKSGDMERVMPHVVRAIEEPRVGQSYPNYCISGLASRFNKVVLAGTGGDELFGGYPWRYYHAASGFDSIGTFAERYFEYWQRLVPENLLPEVMAPVWSEARHFSPREQFWEVLADGGQVPQSSEECINLSLRFEAKTFLHGLLVVEDKLAMAHGLEVRVPFLDNDLVEYAMHLPVSHKVQKLNSSIMINENDPGNKSAKYFQRTRDGKALLRKVMQRYLPSEIVFREKQGFSAPDASWFKGESIDFVRRELYSPNIPLYDYLDKKSVLKLVDEHLSGQTNRRLFVWALLSLNGVLRSFTTS